MADFYDDLFSYAEDLNSDLKHYGMPKRSGRYPYGSGEDPNQHGSGDFLSRVKEYKKQGMSEVDIAKAMGMKSTDELRTRSSLEVNALRSYRAKSVRSMRQDGKSWNEIAESLGLANESTARSLYKEGVVEKSNKAKNIAELIKKEVDQKKMVDVGAGVELELNVSKEKMKQALALMKDEGYNVYPIGIPQVTNRGQETKAIIATTKDVKYGDVYKHMADIKPFSSEQYFPDSSDQPIGFKYPASIKSDRIKIRYGDEGGKDMDGVIQIRRNVPDLSLGNSRYAQVRILVDGDRYLKGMAIYSDKMPDGCDIVFNTNKKSGTDKRDVLKEISKDPDNPFGAAIKPNGEGQSTYVGKDGKEKLSAINKVHDEGDWDEYKKGLASQFLSKQSLPLIKRQLDLAYADKVAEYDEIKSLNNPAIKQHFLKNFSDDCDKSAVELKAASLPRQKYQVILPVPSLKDNEVYATNYRDGEQVALIRYPHAGQFEIPILRVNNKQKDARSTLGTDLTDAIGINPKVAERLSGADFDGDNVLVIPLSSKVKISNKPPLKGLEGFDPKEEYGTTKIKTGKKDSKGNDIDIYLNKNGDKIKPISKALKQREMGIASNLITDMTLKGAEPDEMAAAVRHSMVVIDSEKHKLDYKQSEIDNNIASLRKRYQGHIDPNDGRYHEGASTLISSSKSETRINKRQGSPRIDKATGEYIYKESGASYINKKGKLIVSKQTSTKMYDAKDAHILSSGLPVEEAYADYANKMKALGNTARKEMISTPNLHYSKSANEAYSDEVKSLDAKLFLAKKNLPKERQAQVIANGVIKAKLDSNPDLKADKKEVKKLANQEIVRARNLVGAKSNRIDISDKEWEAIQSGAISHTKLHDILMHSDPDKLRDRATPYKKEELSDAKQTKLKLMKQSGYTNIEIADALGVSTSTVSKYGK